MTPAPDAAIVGGMAHPVQLSIEVDPESVPITGWAQRPGGDQVQFVGWFELAAALDRLISSRGSAGDGKSNSEMEG